MEKETNNLEDLGARGSIYFLLKLLVKK